MSTATPGPSRHVAPSAASKSGRALLAASTLMAAGTLVSRILGLVRNSLQLAALGGGKKGDAFSIATTLPQTAYNIIAGGVLSAVLVPLIVRATKDDDDDGESYINRIVTLTLVVMAGATLLCLLGTPWLLHVMAHHEWFEPANHDALISLTMLTYLTVPQIFFWGLFLVTSQVLNAREHFGPMMWAPIANNVVTIVMFVLYLLVYGGRGDGHTAFTGPQIWMLGVGTTLGIVAQAGVAIYYLRHAGVRYRPRFDFRHTGLGRTFHVAKWAILTVLATQVAVIIVNQIANGATAKDDHGAGQTILNTANLMWMMPHGLITVSLTTALITTVASAFTDGRMDVVRRETMRGIRLADSLIIPIAVALVVFAMPISQVLFGYGRGHDSVQPMAWTLAAYALGLPVFTTGYVLARTLYATEDTRAAFFCSLVFDLAQIPLSFILVLAFRDPRLTAPLLALATSLAGLPQLWVTLRLLRHRVPGIPAGEIFRHLVRVLLATLPAALVGGLLMRFLTNPHTPKLVTLLALAFSGLVAAVLYYLAARLLHISEVQDMVGMVTRKLRRRGGTGATELPGPAIPAPAPFGDLEQTRSAADPGDEGAPGIGWMETIDAASDVDASRAPGVDPEDAGDARPDRDEDQAGGTPAGAGFRGTDEPTQQFALLKGGRADEPDSGKTAERPAISDAEPDSGVRGPVADVGAGMLLADRYKLTHFVARRGTTVTWQARDEALSRTVLVHVLRPGDPREGEILAAARRASAATDSRFLRVLDAMRSTDPNVGALIVCEFAPGANLESVLAHGPLSALEAGWLVRELADALATMHAENLFHGRLNPETVVITNSGNIKIVGFGTEAALHPHPDDDSLSDLDWAAADVESLGKILYACLIGRWPGGHRYGLPAAPRQGERWLSPREVRSDASPALDQICDQILSRPPRAGLPALRSAADVMVALHRVLGSADASQDLERRVTAPVDGPSQGTQPRGYDGRGPRTSQPVPPSGADDDIRTQVQPAVGPDGRPMGAGGTPLTYQQVEQVHGDAARVHEQALRQAQPATDSDLIAVGAPVRRSHARRNVGLLTGFVVGSIVIGLLLLFGRPGPLHSGAPGQGPRGTQSAAGAMTPLAITGAKDFDPDGSGQETPGEVRYAYDGNKTTAWHTENYTSAGLGNNVNHKTGVGLYVDLGTVKDVRRVVVTVSGATNFQVRVPTQGTDAPATSAAWTTIGEATGVDGDASVVVKPTQTRYVLIWITGLPQVSPGTYQATVDEIEVDG